MLVRILPLLFITTACGGIADLGDAGTADAAKDVTNETGGPCVLSPSSYVTSCNADSDCISVWLGDACSSKCFCPNASINASSSAQYEKDRDATNHGGGICACPAFPSPTCCNGTCSATGCK